MRQGRLRLASGFSMNCSYEFFSEGEGCLELATALYNSLGEDEEVTLVLADDSERLVRISLKATAGMVGFRVLRGPSR